jgi:hypothetical protein
MRRASQVCQVDRNTTAVHPSAIETPEARSLDVEDPHCNEMAAAPPRPSPNQSGSGAQPADPSQSAAAAAAAASVATPTGAVPPLGFHKLSKDPCYPAYAEALACESWSGQLAASSEDPGPLWAADAAEEHNHRCRPPGPQAHPSSPRSCIPIPGLDKNKYVREFCADHFRAFNECRSALVRDRPLPSTGIGRGRLSDRPADPAELLITKSHSMYTRTATNLH